MTKLSKTQRDLLEAALQSADGHVETPDGQTRAVGGLIRRGLTISIPRQDGPSQLLITQTGRDLCGSASAALADREPDTRTVTIVDPASPTPKGKIGALLDLLRQPDGATVEAMMAATGWQAHSVRGALSGAIKKKLGLAVTSEKTAAGRIYRIGPEACQAGDDAKATA
jgi:hypothetical protein